MSKEETNLNNGNDEETKNNNEEEENQEPIQEDCFEYVLAGVTVHSGSANAGHYWSLISTERDGLGRKKNINY
jgi:ubiquitin C-terminal hydrolase